MEAARQPQISRNQTTLADGQMGSCSRRGKSSGPSIKRSESLITSKQRSLVEYGPTWISTQEEVRESVSEMNQSQPECVKEMTKTQAVRDLTLLVKNTPEVGLAPVINCEDYSDFSKLCRITT